MTAPTKKELEIVLRLRDEVGKGVASTKRELDKIKPSVDKTTEGARKRFIDWEKAVVKLREALKSLANPLTLIAGSIGVGAVIAIAKGMSDAADQAEALQGKFDLVFGDRAEAYRARMGAIADELGRGQLAMQQLAADTQPVIEQLLGSADAADTVTEAIVRLSADVADYANVADEEVAGKLLQALQGSAEALRGFSTVAIKPAEVDAKAFALGLADVNGELTETDRVVARLNLIFDRFQNVQGEAANGTRDFGGRMKELLGVVQDTRAEFGERLNQAILKGLDRAGGAQKIRELVEVFYATIAELSSVGVTIAAELAAATGEALREFGGAEGVIKWLQDRGNLLTANVKLLGAELASVAVQFAQAVERMVERLRPALEFLGLVNGEQRSLADTMLRRDIAEWERREAQGEAYIAGLDKAGQGIKSGPLAYSYRNAALREERALARVSELDEEIAALDAEIARQQRLAEFDAARVQAREQLAAAQDRVNQAEMQSAMDADPWASADFSGLGPALRSATSPSSTTTRDAVEAAREASIQAVAASESWVQYGEALVFTADSAREYQEAVAEVSQADRFGQRQVAQLSDAFLSVALRITSAKDALKQFFASFIQDLLRVQTNQAFGALFGQVFSGIFSAFNPAPSSAGFIGPPAPGYSGGYVKGYARGGFIDPRDTVPAMLAPGEFVMRREAVQSYGRGFMEQINRGGGAIGGGLALSVNITALDARSAVEVIAGDSPGFAALVQRALSQDRTLNDIIRGRTT